MTASNQISAGTRPVKVFSIPGRMSTTRYVALFCRGLEDAGVEVVDLHEPCVWRLGFDVINIHFPVHYISERSLPYSLCRSLLSLAFYLTAKFIGGIKLVYTVHDVTPFRPRSGWLLWPTLNLIHALTDGYMFLSASSREEFIRHFPREQHKPWVRIDHSAFPVVLREKGMSTCREALLSCDRPAFLVGFLGLIKDYKGLEFLPLLPSQLEDGTPVRLVIAGKVDKTYRLFAEPILTLLEKTSFRIDKRLTDDELEALIQAVDVVVLPYTRGWNSGMAMLVLSLHARILATCRPLFLELRHTLGAPWVYTFDGDTNSLTRSISDVLNTLSRDAIGPVETARLEAYLSDRSFIRAGEMARDFYKCLRRKTA